jgi:hypothetical protein
MPFLRTWRLAVAVALLCALCAISGAVAEDDEPTVKNNRQRLLNDEARLDAIEAQAQMLNADINKERSTTTTRLDAMEGQDEALNDMIGKVRQTVATATTRIDGVEGQAAALFDLLKKNTKAVAAVQLRTDALVTQTAVTNDSVGKHTAEVASLKGQVNALEEQIRAAHADVAAQTERSLRAYVFSGCLNPSLPAAPADQKRRLLSTAAAGVEPCVRGNDTAGGGDKGLSQNTVLLIVGVVAGVALAGVTVLALMLRNTKRAYETEMQMMRLKSPLMDDDRSQMSIEREA